MTKIIKPVHNNRHKNRFHHNFIKMSNSSMLLKNYN